MEFKFSDKTVAMFNELAKGLTVALNEKADREQNEMLEAFRYIAVYGKILYDECLNQGFSENEAIKFATYYLGNMAK